MVVHIFWILAGCITIVSPQNSPFFNPVKLPSLVQVTRNWYASPSDKIGTVVTKIHSGVPSIFELETDGSPVPFAIDRHTGVVKVNDTLKDKEDQNFYVWVKIKEENDDAIPQKIQVLATITNDPGAKLRPHPPNLANYPYPFPPSPYQPIPKLRNVTTSTAKPAEIPLETTSVPDTTTPSTTKDLPVTEVLVPSTTEVPKTNDVPLTLIPLIAIGGLVVIVAAVILFVWKKNTSHKSDPKKEDITKDANGIVLRDSSATVWDRPQMYSNRYEAWDANHLQPSEETSVTSITKEEPRDEWEFPRHRLRIFNIVGEGAFGQVWRAQAIDIDGKKGEVTVAVKTLKENASEKEKSDLVQELIVMKNLGHHPNVVRLIACCTEKEPTLVIMEFVSLGKLQQYLRDSRAEKHYGNTHGGSQFLTSRDLTHFAYQVARGMDFLSSKGIIHRDLAARNVLITEERTCKVADFGFARDVGGTHVYERKSDGRLPIRWMAPESLYDDIFSVKSDIWSFGVLLWEIVTLGSTPYPGLSASDVMRKVREGHRLEKPEHCRRELYNIMFYCWEAEPTTRPDFKEVVTMLERLLCTETDYIELERFPDHSYYNLLQLEGEKV